MRLILFICMVCFFSCNRELTKCERKLKRIEKKCPKQFEVKDTVFQYDTVIAEIKADTVVKVNYDTLVIDSILREYVHDTIIRKVNKIISSGVFINDSIIIQERGTKVVIWQEGNEIKTYLYVPKIEIKKEYIVRTKTVKVAKEVKTPMYKNLFFYLFILVLIGFILGLTKK